MREGDLLTLDLSPGGLHGAAAARAGDASLQVRGGFAGERVEARLLELNRRRTLGRARVTRVLEPHAGRREAPCEHHPERGGRCDGCAYMPLSLTAQREEERAFLAGLGLEVAEVEGDDVEWGYRLSSKRVALSGPGGLYLGSYQQGSHRGARMEHCLVDHPALCAAVSWLTGVLRDAGCEAYDARRGRGDLRYVWLRTDGTQVLATLVTAREESAAVEALRHADRPAHMGLAHSVQAGEGNAMRGDPARPLGGPQDVAISLCGQTLIAGPLGFVQPNPGVAGRCYEALVPSRERGTRAVDLYAGAGVTTALLRARFDEVIASEAHPESAAQLGVAPETAEACLQRLVQAGGAVDLVVANPPRAGLRPEVCALLRALAPARLHVMSCGPEGLVRDLAALEADGVYVKRSLRAFDTLPHTPHVELVAQLVRVSAP